MDVILGDNGELLHNNSLELTEDMMSQSVSTIQKVVTTPPSATQGVPVLQITITHAGNTHNISKDDQYEYQYKSASGEISSLPFDNVDDDMIEVNDGESTFTLKRSMVYDYRKQANYYGALKVFRERTKVKRSGKEEVVIRTSLIQVKVTAKGKDGKQLGPNEIAQGVIKTPGIIPPVEAEEVESYVPPTNTNMVPITFGNHIVDINKKAIEQFKKITGVNKALKAQLSKLYKCKNGVDVPITVVKLLASVKKGSASSIKAKSNHLQSTKDALNVMKWPQGSPITSKKSLASRASIIPAEDVFSNDADVKHYLTTKSTEVHCDLSQLGRSWVRFKPRDAVDSDMVPEADYVPQDLNEVISSDLLWHYLESYAKDLENIIDFEYEINEDRWLELKRASNTFHVNGEMWPDVVVKIVYRLNKTTKEYEITYFVRVLGRLIKTGILLRGVDVNHIIQMLSADRKICVGVMATPYLQLLDKNIEMCKMIKKEGLLILHPFESLHSEKCCGLVRDVSQVHSNSFRRGSVGIEGEQVVCPPCLTLCSKLNQLFSVTDSQTKPKAREQQSSVVSSSAVTKDAAGTSDNSGQALVGIGAQSALRGSRVKEIMTQSLDEVLRGPNTRRALLEEDARLGLPASKKVALDENEFEDNRPDVVLSQEQFVSMIDVRRPEVGGTKKNLYKSCSYCNFRAKSLLALFVHMKDHLGVMQENCSKCKASFSDKDALERHRIETHGQKTPECPVCFVEFTNNDQLYDHMNRHRPHHPFICSYCSSCFFTLDTYKKHLKSIHKIQSVNDLQISCKTCHTHFYTQDYLIIHRLNMNHNDIDLFTCKVCGFDFDTSVSFREHIMEHTEEERDVANIAVCPTCFKVFFSAYRLNFHIERCHLMPKGSKGSEQTNQVSEQPVSRKNAKGPYMRYLKQTEKNTCTFCNRRFKTDDILQSHIGFCHKGRGTGSKSFEFEKKLGLLDGNKGQMTNTDAEYTILPESLNLPEGAEMVIDGSVVQMENGGMVEMGQDLMEGGSMIHVDANMMQVANDLVQVGNSFVSLNTSMIPDNNTKFITTTSASAFDTATTDSTIIMKPEEILENFFACEICGRKFESEVLLEAHLKIHSGNRPVFQCEECGQIYSKKQQVLEHIRLDHADQVQQHATTQQQDGEMMEETSPSVEVEGYMETEQHQIIEAEEVATEQVEAAVAEPTEEEAVAGVADDMNDGELLVQFVDQASEQQVEVQTAQVPSQEHGQQQEEVSMPPLQDYS